MHTNDIDFEAEQACFMTIDWFRDAKVEIDRLFGEGYAKKNPELIGKFIQTASIKYHASTGNSNNGLGMIASSIEYLADCINSANGKKIH